MQLDNYSIYLNSNAPWFFNIFFPFLPKLKEFASFFNVNFNAINSNIIKETTDISSFQLLISLQVTVSKYDYHQYHCLQQVAKHH